MRSHIIVDTHTGTPIQRVHPSEEDWKTSITSVGTGRHAFQLRDAETRLDRATWQNLSIPWARTLVTCWDNVPQYAGLIGGHIYDPFTGRLELATAEIRAIFSSRMSFGVPQFDPNGVSTATGSLRDIMRHIIFWGALQYGSSEGWWLPIAVPPVEGGSETRSWQHYNFETIEQLLSQIEGAEGGPDLHLRPRWGSTGLLEWEARIGTPLLDGPTFEYDMTAEETGLTGYPVHTDATRQLTGAFALGMGSEADMKVGRATMADVPGPIIPQLDATRSFKTIADPIELWRRAISELRAFRWPSVAATPSVLASDVLPSMTLGSTIRVRFQDDEFLDDGWRSSLVTGISGDLTDKLTLEVQ
ncbi:MULTISPECIES: hypothetical protein [Bacteria]|uniref:hypothetical protein n=1 Tax=Bacteria TaxID=2 RepID=UPI003C7C04A7